MDAFWQPPAATRVGPRPDAGQHAAEDHQTQALEGEVHAGFGRHPDAEIYLSQPGLGPILGARVLAEF